MKKLLLPVVLAAFALTSCQKVMEVFDRVPVPPGVDTNKYVSKDTGCTVTAQSGSFFGEEPRSQISGFRKVINSTTGRLDSLITASGGLFEVDSFFYVTEYLSDTVIHFTGVVKTYNRLNDMHLWQFENANELNFDVHLDATGHASFTTIGPTVGIEFNYEHGRLVSLDFPNDPAPYSHVTFTYDDHGNLTKIFRGNQENNTTYTFEYNLSHSALSQIYTPVPGYELYEIMGWIPIAPHNLRTRATIVNHVTTDGTPEETVISDIGYTNHVLNNFNALRQFDAHVTAIGYDVTVLNTLECAIDRRWHLPN